MYTTATKANRIITTDLDVTYQIEQVAYTNASAQTAYWYRVTRTATKNYSYLDLTETAAATVAAERVAMYTRPYYVLDRRAASATHPQSIAVSRLTSSVTTANADGPCWRVDIAVNETDVRASASLPYDPADLFTIENARNYDESDGTIEIVQAYVAEPYDCVLIETDLPDEDIEGCLVQYKRSASASSWTTAETQRAGKTFTTASLQEGDIVRVVYGHYESNVATVTAGPVGQLSIDSVTQHRSGITITYIEEIPAFTGSRLSAYYRVNVGDTWHAFENQTVEETYSWINCEIPQGLTSAQFIVRYNAGVSNIESEPYNWQE